MIKKLLVWLAAIGLLLMDIIGVAHATVMKVSYQAIVTDISPRLIGGSLHLDDTISGYYVVDTEMGFPYVQKWGPNDEWSQTFFENALQQCLVKIGNETFEFFGGFVRTDPNTVEETQYSIYTRGGPLSASSPDINGLPVNSLSLSFSPYPRTFPLDVIPEYLPPFNPVTNPARLFLFFTPLGNDSIAGTLTSVTMESAPVPEPSSILLLGAGIAGFATIGIRRKKRS